MDRVPITISGFAALEAELKDRMQVQRQRIIQAISEARRAISPRMPSTIRPRNSNR